MKQTITERLSMDELIRYAEVGEIVTNILPQLVPLLLKAPKRHKKQASHRQALGSARVATDDNGQAKP